MAYRVAVAGGVRLSPGLCTACGLVLIVWRTDCEGQAKF